MHIHPLESSRIKKTKKEWECKGHSAKHEKKKKKIFLSLSILIQKSCSSWILNKFKTPFDVVQLVKRENNVCGKLKFEEKGKISILLCYGRGIYVIMIGIGWGLWNGDMCVHSRVCVCEVCVAVSHSGMGMVSYILFSLLVVSLWHLRRK